MVKLKATTLALTCVLIMSAVGYAQTQHRFRNPESERKYNEARRDEQRYRAEQRKQEARVRSLQRYERPAKVVQGAADQGVRQLEKRTGLPGRGIGAAYRAERNTIMDPQFEQKQRDLRVRQQREGRAYQEKQQRYRDNVNRRVETQSRQIQRNVDKVSRRR